MINSLKNRAYNFLYWSQKYTQTDMVYLAKGGFWLTLGQVVSTTASFLLAIAFANLIDPITFGNYRYVLSLMGVLSIFALTGIGTAVTQAVARGLEGSFYTAFKTKLKWGLLGSMAALGLAGYYFFRGNYLLSIPLLISTIFLPLMLASQVYDSFLAGRKLFSVGTKYNISKQIIFVGAMVTTLFLTQNLFWLIAVYFVSHTFLNLFFYLFTKRKFQPNKKEDPQTLSYGKHLSLVGVISTIAAYLDRVLIFHYLGAMEVAIYSFAIMPIDQMKSLFKNIPTLAIPKLAQRSFKEINAVLYKRLFKLFLIGGGIAIVYILLAPYLFKIFFPRYLNSIFFSQLFVLTFIFILPHTLLSATIRSKLTLIPKSIIYRSTLAQIVLIISLFVLVKLYEIIGIVFAKILFAILVMFISFINWRDLTKIYSDRKIKE